MAKYVISGASAAMGKFAAEKLLETIQPAELTMISRSPAALQEFGDRGVNVLAGHHGDAGSLREGYQDADCLFMISSLAVGERIAHHRETIDVAKEAGVKHIVYTSVAGAHPLNPTPSAMEHTATEAMLHDSGLGYTALRGQVYHELMLGMFVNEGIEKGGKLRNNVDKGRFSPVSRDDIALSAAAIMLSPEHHNRMIYEITGPERLTFHDVTTICNKLLGSTVEYSPVTDEEMYEIFDASGVPRIGDPSQEPPPLRFGSDELVKQMSAYELGFLDIVSGHVKLLTGHEPRSLETTLKNMLAEMK